MAKNMETPFVFGVRVEGDAFTDRREETERLKANFTYGVNTILISPRRMGKTSLVDKVCSLVEGDDIKIARIDAFGCRSENDFIMLLPRLSLGRLLTTFLCLWNIMRVIRPLRRC